MTVEELIQRLGDFDPAMRVIMHGDGLTHLGVGGVFEDLVVERNGEFELADERDGPCLRVVRLFPPDERP